MTLGGAPGGPGGRPGRNGGDRLLADALESYLRGQGHGRALLLARITAAWPDVVGPEVAAHASPRALRDRTLVVSVDHAAWATQLGFLAEKVLEGLAEVVGPGLVEALEATLRRS